MFIKLLTYLLTQLTQLDVTSDNATVNQVRSFLSSHSQIIVQYVKGHSGIPGNHVSHSAALNCTKQQANYNVSSAASSSQLWLSVATAKHLISYH